MALTWWWTLPIAALVVLGAAAAYVTWRRRSRARLRRSGVPVAHSERLTALPTYQRLVRRYRAALVGTVVALALLGGSAAVLTARPSTVDVVQPESSKRDVVLCLDVSGSMTEVDSEIVETFSSLVEGLDGERIGLTLFDSSAVQAFPLTADYDFVQERLLEYRDSFDSFGEDGQRFWTGTDLGDGASLIGDGLASCVLAFDGGDDSTRPRSIVLATDNYVNGAALLGLDEAAELATERGVRVYAINPADHSTEGAADEIAAELRAAVESTDGAYYAADASDAVPGIVAEIDAREAGLFDGTRRLVVTDAPQAATIVALLALGAALVLLWRFRL